HGPSVVAGLNSELGRNPSRSGRGAELVLLLGRAGIVVAGDGDQELRLAVVELVDRRGRFLSDQPAAVERGHRLDSRGHRRGGPHSKAAAHAIALDRKSTRLNSSHVKISYAV